MIKNENTRGGALDGEGGALDGEGGALDGEGGVAGRDEPRAGGGERCAREMLIIGCRRHPSRRGFNFWALPDAAGG